MLTTEASKGELARIKLKLKYTCWYLANRRAFDVCFFVYCSFLLMELYRKSIEMLFGIKKGNFTDFAMHTCGITKREREPLN